MSSDQLERIKALIAEAVAGDPGSFILELSQDSFDPIGAALDAATGHAQARGYDLTRVRAEDDRWVASYAKPRSED